LALAARQVAADFPAHYGAPVVLLETLGEKPTESIPAACGGWDQTRAAYRLFDHPEVTAEAVLAPHIACTEQRLREHPRVLCVQDTTELDYTKKLGIAGLGPLNYETRRGMYLHPTLALTPERVPLGLLDLHRWVREPGSLGQKKDPNRPLEEKESVRWVDGFARVNELAERLAETRLTYIADRESDIYDLFVEAPCPERGADWLVRVQHQQRLLADGRKLREVIDAAPVLTEITFDRPASNGRRSRTVHQQIKVARVTLKAPSRPDRTLADVTVTALLATEANPPADVAPARLAAADQSASRNTRAGNRKARLVSLPLANLGVLQGAQERLPYRTTAAGDARTPAARAGLLHDHRMAGAVPDDARARVPGNCCATPSSPTRNGGLSTWSPSASHRPKRRLRLIPWCGWSPASADS
jgi:hypothetical protein